MRKILATITLFSFAFLLSTTCFAQDDNAWNKTNKKGQKEGPWRDYYENGELRYKGQFKEDKPFDVFRYYFDDGTLKTVLQFNETSPEKSSAVHYYQTGTKMAEGDYVDQKRSGGWKTYGANEVLVEEGSYISGRKFGDWKIYYANGNVLNEVYMENDLEKGVKKHYFPTGELKKEELYKDGIRKGATTLFSIDGDTIVKGNFEKDVRHGKWYFYNDNGELDKVLEFDMGKLLNRDEIEDIYSDPGEDLRNVKDELDFEDLKGKIRYE